MPLKQGTYKGTIFDKMVTRFTMFDGPKEVLFAASWDLLDDMEKNRGPEDREAQFERIRVGVEELAQRKYYNLTDEGRLAAGEILLTTKDRSER